MEILSRAVQLGTGSLREGGEQVPARVGRPVDQDQGGVVLESSALVGEDGGGEPAQCFGCRQPGEFGATGQVDQAVLAEELAVGVAGLGDAVGVQQQPVAGSSCSCPTVTRPEGSSRTPSGVRGG